MTTERGMATDELFVLGNGPFALEAVDLAERLGWRIGGLVNNVDEVPLPDFDGLPVYGEAEGFRRGRWAVCALGTTRRRGMISQAASAGMRFATLIHPGAHVSPRAEIGEGCIVSAGAVIGAGARIRDHVIVNRGALIGHHAEIGAVVSVGPGADLCGSCRIGDGVYIGAGAVLQDRIDVGAGAAIAIGSVVTKNVPAAALASGVPARIIRRNIDPI